MSGPQEPADPGVSLPHDDLPQEAAPLPAPPMEPASAASDAPVVAVPDAPPAPPSPTFTGGIAFGDDDSGGMRVHSIAEDGSTTSVTVPAGSGMLDDLKRGLASLWAHIAAHAPADPKEG